MGGRNVVRPARAGLLRRDMILFLDTEHTGFGRPAADRKLLSLALVAEDGRAEWYAEVDGWTPADCTPWVRRHVLPLFTGPHMARVETQNVLWEWFAARPRSVRVACDSPIDWTLLLELLGERPPNLVPNRYDLAPLIDQAVYHGAVGRYFAAGHPEHHALHDARAYRLGWLAWMDTTKGLRG